MFNQPIKVMKRLKTNSQNQLNRFEAGDKVAIHDVMTGELTFTGTILSIANRAMEGKAWAKWVRPAIVEIDASGGGRVENSLATAVLL